MGTIPGNCGDDKLQVMLGAGTYTLLLTDANFLPIPVNPQTPGAYDLTDTTSNVYGSSTSNGAYTDITAGVFQTCETLTDCNTDTGNFAVDILGTPGASAVPEPSEVGVSSFLLAILVSSRVWVQSRRSRRLQSDGASCGAPLALAPLGSASSPDNGIVNPLGEGK